MAIVDPDLAETMPPKPVSYTHLIVVNTTQITFHTEVTKMILDAGKNVYSEKMMGCSFEDAKANIESVSYTHLPIKAKRYRC